MPSDKFGIRVGCCCRLYSQIHNQYSEYKQVQVKKNDKQEIEVMVTENLYLVKHQQQTRSQSSSESGSNYILGSILYFFNILFKFNNLLKY
jgi:hypothetical protein